MSISVQSGIPASYRCNSGPELSAFDSKEGIPAGADGLGLGSNIIHILTYGTYRVWALSIIACRHMRRLGLV